MSAADLIEQHLFSCSVKQLFGLDCPGCGMQRAFVALLRGDLLASLRFNASLIPFLFTVFYTTAHLVFGFRNGARWTVFLFSTTVLIMLLNFLIKLVWQH
jgi:hypothetical protein